MKKLLTLLLLVLSSQLFAADRYIRTGGNDANSGLDSANAWATISKVNSFFSSLSNGDHVYFHRGDTFYGTITISKSGASGNPITIGAFGTGAKPIITGFTTITSGWTNEGGGIYSKVITSAAQTNMVTIDGVQYGVGRFPDASYLTYNGWSGTTKIWRTGMGSATNWTGANIAIRKNDFIMERDVITAHLNDTLTYTPTSTSWNPTNNFGFFIENDLRTLSTYGEWYHDFSTGKFYMYFGGVIPATKTVNVATINAIISASSFDYWTLDNLNIQGAINNAVDMTFGQLGVVIQNCSVSFAGKYGINTLNATGTNLINNTSISYCNSVGLYYESSGANTASNNTITYIGSILGQAYGVNGTGVGIQNQFNTNLTVSNNTIRVTGYNGIYVSTSSTESIINNFIDSACILFDDGGAIYTSSASTTTRRLFDGNIILNTIGNRIGTATPAGNSLSGGIYLDEFSSHVKVSNNTISGSGYFAVKIHKGSFDTVINNTGYDNRVGIDFTDYTGNQIRNNIVKNNIWFAKTASQYVLDNYSPINNDQSLYGIVDSNYYDRPIANTSPFFLNTPGNVNVTKTLGQWQSISSQDAHSVGAPKTISNVSELRFNYNFSATPIASSFLGLRYMDVYGVNHDNADTIPAYSSRVLMLVGTIPPANLPPVVNAGSDQIRTLPTNTTILIGSATDPVGTVTAYLWTKISGPVLGTITTPTSASTGVTGLVQGVYFFQLRATNNFGINGFDTMTVTVNPAPVNQLPVVNAGVDKNITLPTNTVSVTGTASDPDGTIASVLWSFVSGPATATFGTANAVTTSINNLTIAGTYVIRFTGTDNSGGSSSDFMQIVVNPANIRPTANAGADQAITLPTTTATLVGSGTDPDGTIITYAWVKLSGPAGTITSPSSATTGLTGLSIAGNYLFQLTVTDNNGLTGADVMQLTVNPAIPPPNVPPNANAGPDKSITLPINSVTLIGSGTDTDGTIVSYQWTKVSGGAATITSPNSATTNITSLVAGTYQFRLRVTDNNGDTGIDAVQVVVNPANIPPNVAAGIDQTITLPANIVHLSATITDVDGTITSIVWTKISGPTGGSIVSPNSASTDIINLIEGSYIYQVKAFDNNGDSSSDAVQITVLAQPINQNPVSYAGSNQAVVLPTTTTALSGYGTDADGYIFSYRWTLISNPSGASVLIQNATSNITGIVGLNFAGDYIFRLTVTDNSGGQGFADVTVTVIAPTSSGTSSGKNYFKN